MWCEERKYSTAILSTGAPQTPKPSRQRAAQDKEPGFLRPTFGTMRPRTDHRGSFMDKRLWKVAILLFGSGFCALVYQTVWLREFRFIFGMSTPASAAVLAIFMGGLGLGGAILGRKVDRMTRPLRFYGFLELGIAVTAAITPALVWAVREIYVALGGTVSLGLTFGTIVRLLLSVLVLGVPTFLMGGTLPAAARAVEHDNDFGRANLAALYGLNTIGAVVGVFLGGFVLLEAFGLMKMLMISALFNVIVALSAISLSRRLEGDEKVATTAKTAESGALAENATPSIATHLPIDASTTPTAFVLFAAFGVGWVFFLMELVWYRMLAPLLGGSTYTFNLILSVALAGIGLGGATYAFRRNNRPATITGFALTCSAEAAFIALPFALGDRLAVFTALLGPLGFMGFSGQVLAWTIVTSIVVLPAAFVSGIQFPLLIGLLGKGKKDIGRQAGQMYAFNTAGAILGSLAGGFGILPLLSAIGSWILSTILLAMLALAAVVFAFRDRSQRSPRLILPIAIALLAVMFTLPQGPTAAWRHSPIGAGRVKFKDDNPNSLQNWVNDRRRTFDWEAEGIEATVALQNSDGLAFYVSGKSDGNAWGDAPTQIMSGLIGALLHPNPTTSFVIGLGTGSTAGWLGKVPTMEHVDAVELEPAILEVSEYCRAVNEDVLDNDRVNILVGDAREVLLATKNKYDLIFSEPSNPYRAGISSLYTVDFYEVARDHLNDGGLFMKFLQGYEVDSQTVRTVVASLWSVFSNIEIWRMGRADILLMGSMSPIPHDLAQLRVKSRQEPYQRALWDIWRVRGAEGFLSHFVAGQKMAAVIASQEGDRLSTDDLTLVEFGFARNVGRMGLFRIEDMLMTSRMMGIDRPETFNGTLDPLALDEEGSWSFVSQEGSLEPPVNPTPVQARRHALQQAWFAGDFQTIRNMYASLPTPSGPENTPATNMHPMEAAVYAEALASFGDPASIALLPLFAKVLPGEELAVKARFAFVNNDLAVSGRMLVELFKLRRTNPWHLRRVTMRALALASDVARGDPAVGRQLFDALKEPFAVSILNEERRRVRVELAAIVDFAGLCASALAEMEPNIPYTHTFLSFRHRCYSSTGNALADLAGKDLAEFLLREPRPFASGLF